jgi:hypothetical protein
LEEFKSILGLLFVSAVLALSFYAGSFLPGLASDMSAQAVPKDNAPPLLYNDDDEPLRSDFKMNDERIVEFVPLSSGSSYGYSGSPGISVQQNVIQQNVCSSNTAYCYNEVDNDFNVNPP